MRSDLNKVLCEQPRDHSEKGYDEYRHNKLFERLYDRHEELDDELFTGVSSGHRESMKYRYGYETKNFGEHLSPLHGIVRKNVGRPWDKVYSELRQVFDARSVVNAHILQHIYDQLADPKDTFLNEDGKVYVRGFYGRGAEPISETYYEFYVDPRDGIIKINKHRKTYKQANRASAARAAAEAAKVRRVIDESTELLKLDGLWYEVKFEDAVGTTSTRNEWYTYSNRSRQVTNTVYPPRYDVVKKTNSDERRVAVSKRALSHKELKRHGLLA